MEEKVPIRSGVLGCWAHVTMTIAGLRDQPAGTRPIPKKSSFCPTTIITTSKPTQISNHGHVQTPRYPKRPIPRLLTIWPSG